jgi:hypothetical protein
MLLICDNMEMRCILRYVLAEIWTRTFMAGKHHLESQSRDSGRYRMGKLASEMHLNVGK